jgi:hypothetical protein
MDTILRKKNSLVKIIMFCLLFSITTTTIFSSVVVPINNTYAAEESDIDEEPGRIEEAFFKIFARAGDSWLSLTGGLLGVVGLMLNKVVDFSIINMATYTKDDAITNSWAVIRDLLNIFFIFGLLYISIKTIISSWSSNTKKLLSRLIVAAILINFSFFFTSVLIDVSNVITLNIYKEMSGGCYNIGTDSSSLSNCWLNEMKTNSIYQADTTGSGKYDSIFDNKGATKGDWTDFIILTFMGGFVFIFASIVFFAIAIALLVRFISLIFILVTSPVMFAGHIFPNFSKMTSKWSSKLQEELLFAPIVFIFLLISYTMVKVIGTELGDVGSFSSALKDINSSSVGVFLNFIIIIGFLVGSLLAAKTVGNSIAGAGANFAGKWIGKAGNKIGGGFMRNTIGRGAAKAADSIKGTSRVSQRLKSGLNKVGNASFDARNSKTFKGVASKTGITFGEGQKGGFRDAQSSRIKTAKSRYESAAKLTSSEQADRDKYKKELEKKTSVGGALNGAYTSIKNAEKQKKQLLENRNSLQKDNNPTSDWSKNERMIKAQQNIITNNTNIIKNDSSAQAIKSIDDKLKDRRDKTLEALGKTTAKFNEFISKTTNGRSNNFINSSTLKAAREIRNEKEKNRDKDKISVDNIINS